MLQAQQLVWARHLQAELQGGVEALAASLVAQPMQGVGGWGLIPLGWVLTRAGSVLAGGVLGFQGTTRLRPDTAWHLFPSTSCARMQ